MSREQGMLSVSQRKGVILLLHKKNKDPESVKNWRPFSLVNVNYKIMTKSLSKRMEKVIERTIRPNQSGFIKERFRRGSIRLLEDLIECMERKSKLELIPQVSFEKAFISVKRKCLVDFIALKQYRFGFEFISWVRLYHIDIFSTICNGDFTSQWFKLFIKHPRLSPKWDIWENFGLIYIIQLIANY